MVFGSDQRADLSGVPQKMQPAQAADMPRHKDQRSPFWSLFRVAIWLCVAMVVGLAVAFLLNGKPEQTAPDATASQPANNISKSQPDEADVQLREALESYDDVMRNSAAASDLAQRQHAEAMKAVEKARALANNPESQEAREALDRAMRELQAMSQEADRAN